MIQDAPEVDLDIEAIRAAQPAKKVRGGDDIDADIESMRVANTPVSPWTLGFRNLTDEDIDTGYSDLMKLRGFRESAVPGGEDIPFGGFGVTVYDAAQIQTGLAKMKTGRATREDELVVWNWMMDQARTTTSMGTVAELGKSVLTSGLEVLGGAGVAGVGAIAGRKAAQAGLKKFASEWMEKQAQSAIEKRIGEVAVDTGIDLTMAAALKEGAKIAGKGAAVLATTTALQEAVPVAAGAEGGAWTAQAIKNVLGSEMTDEEAQAVADDWHVAIPMLVEKGGGLVDGMIRQSIQMGSEGTGGVLGALPIVKQVDQFFGAMFKFAAGRGVTSASKLARAMLFNEPGGEVAEEFLAAVAEAAIMGDKPILEAAMEVAEITPEMLAAFALPGGAVAGGVRVRDMAQRGGAKGVTVRGVGESMAPTEKGGDLTAAPEATVEGAAPVEALAPEVQAADVESFARDVETATGARVGFRVAEGDLRSDEVAAQRFLRRFGVETTVAEAPEGADLENLPAAFYPGEGRAVILRGQPGLVGAAVHEGLHTYLAQQPKERRADLGNALREIDPVFMGRVEAFVRSQPLYQNVSPEVLAEELTTNAATMLGGLTSYLTTPQGRKDFALVYGKQPGPIRRALGALYDWVAEQIRLLPQRQRALARARLRVARNEGDPALVAQRVLEALREIRPVRAEATSAASVRGAVAPGTAAGSTAAAEVAETVAPRPPKTPADRPTITVSPAGTREERQARREERKAAAKVANTPLPGDTVEYMKRSSNGATIKVTGTVLESTGTGAAQRLRIRINEDVARAGEGRRSASENRARRAESEVIVDRGRVRLVSSGTPQAGSKLERERAKATARLMPRPAPATQQVERPVQAAERAVEQPAAPPTSPEVVQQVAALARKQSRYMGNKREFLAKMPEVVQEAIQRITAKPSTLYDMYAGGATYGLSLAGSGAIPSLRRVVVNEVMPARNAKLRAALREGGAFMDEWDSNAALRKVKADLVRSVEGMASNTPAAPALSVALGESESPTYSSFRKYREALGALSPRASVALRAVADVSFSGRTGPLERWWSVARSDADRVKEHADAARARGVEVVVAQVDAVSAAATDLVRQNGAGMLLLDPPYHQTTAGVYSAGDVEYEFASDEFLNLTLSAAKDMAPGSVILYHNKGTPEVRSAWREAMGSGAQIHSWERGPKDQPEVVGLYDATRATRNVGGGSGRGVQQSSAGGTGDAGRHGVLGGGRGRTGGRRRAPGGAGGAGRADVGGKFAAAYHGSPHDFDRFDMSKIGTGEGAQAYGHGLYFTDTKEIAEHYKNALARKDVEFGGSKYPSEGAWLSAMPPKWRGVVADLREWAGSDRYAIEDVAGEALATGGVEFSAEERAIAEQIANGASTAYRGKLYQVDLKPAEDEYLLWDEPLSRQSEKVKGAIGGLRLNASAPPATGEALYIGLARHAKHRRGVGDNARAMREASQELLARGIRGIKYLDGSSRGKGEGAYNYVLFDDADVTIEGKFAPRPPKDALVANFLEDAEILDLSSKALRAVSDEFLAVERWQRAAVELGATTGSNPISAIRRFFGKVAVKGEPIKDFADKIGDHLRRSNITKEDAGLYAEARHTREAREDFLRKHVERKRLAEERKALVKAAKDVPRDAQFERDLRALEKRIADLDFVPIVIPDGHTAEHYFHDVADVTGMKTSEAEAWLAAHDLPGYARLGRMIDALNRRTLREQLDYQLITPAQFESRRQQFQHYVPLRTAEVDKPERPRGSGFNVRGPETMRRKGRKSLASNPLVMSLAQAMKAVERGEKNAVGHELREFLTENRGVIDSSERDGVAINDEGKPALDSDEFYLKVQGRDVAIKIENPDVARAMKRLGLVQIPKALRLYSALFGYWKLAATSLSPEFMMTNFARDIETALVNVSSVAKDLDLKGLRRDMLKGVASAGRTAWQAARGGPVTTGLGDFFEEYRQAGGKIGSFGSASFEAIEQNMESRMSTSPVGKARRALAPMWSVIEDANGAVEQANRFSLFVALRQRGVSVNDAALAARKITVDFSQKGEWGTALSLAYAFFSAAVGGTRRLAETMNSPVGRRIAGGLVGLGFAQTLANFYSSDDDEDGRKFYEKISEGEKERNAIFMIPGFDEPLKFPLGYGLNVFHGTGRIMAETVLGMHTEGEAAHLMLITALNGFAPIGAAPSLAQFLSPTALDPAVQVIENQNFMGNPITPYESKFGAPSPRYAKSFRTTAPLAIDMAKALNDMTGGDSVKPGALNLSGDEIEHVYGFVGAGVARFISRAFAASRAVVAGESFSEVAQAAPFLRVVYGSRTEFADSDLFYESMDTIEYEKRYLKEAEDAGDRERVREIRDRFRATLALEKAGKRTKEQAKALTDAAYAGGKLTDPEKMREANALMQGWNRKFLEALSAK